MGLEFDENTGNNPPDRVEYGGGAVEDAYSTTLTATPGGKATEVPPELQTGLVLTDERGDTLASCGPRGCTPRRRGDTSPTTDRTAPGPEAGDRPPAGSFAEKVQGFIKKLGDFLSSVLPPDFAAPAKQFLGQIGRFLTENLRGVDVQDRKPDGSRPIEINLEKPVTIPKAIQGQDLEVGPKLSFEMKMGPKGPEINNIKGLKVKVAGGLVDAEVNSARLVRDQDGKLAIEAKVKAAGLVETQVKIPLNRTSLLPRTRR